MKSLLYLYFFSICFQASSQPTQQHRFRYNLKTGACENSKKKKGYNKVDVQKFFGVTLDQAKKRGFKPKKWYKNVDAECVDFRGFNFNTILKLHYSGLMNWNLRGALLDKSKFLFANMSKVDLRGAQLEKLDFGYTTITGKIDTFTKYPKQSCKVILDKKSSTKTLSCRK